MNIDWSKAPEGFDFHFQAKRKSNVGGFYKVANGRLIGELGGYISFADIPKLINQFVINSRPLAIEWADGELPPVWTVCECKLDHISGNWFQVEIIAHFRNKAAMVAAFIPTGESVKKVDQAIAACFRPIRTPEQIAAEERLKHAQGWLKAIEAAYGFVVAGRCEDILMAAESSKQAQP